MAFNLYSRPMGKYDELMQDVADMMAQQRQPQQPQAPQPVLQMPVTPKGVSSDRAWAKSENQSQGQNKQISQNMLTLTPEQMDQMTKQAESNPAYLEQQKGIDELKTQINNYLNIPNQLDVSPLLALADFWTGSNLSSKYKAPQSPQELQQKIMGYNQELQKRREALTSKMEDLMKVQKGGYEAQTIMDMWKNGQLSGIGMKDQGSGRGGMTFSGLATLEDKVRKDADGVQTKLTDAMSNINKIDSAFASGDYQQVVNALNLFARYVAEQKGVLTEGDIVRTLPSNFNTQLAKLESYFNATPTTKVDPKYTQSLRQMMSEAKKIQSESVKSLLDRKKNQFKAMKSVKQAGIDVDGIFKPAQSYADSLSSSEEMVKMIDPNGRTGRMPKSKVEQAIKKGFKVAQ